MIWFSVIYSFWCIFLKKWRSVLWVGSYMGNVLSLSLILLYVEPIMVSTVETILSWNTIHLVNVNAHMHLIHSHRTSDIVIQQT